MLKLSRSSLSCAGWRELGVRLPEYDIAAVAENTAKSPAWIHFGAGNIFRGFIARLQQSLLNRSLSNVGIIAADTFDYEIIDRIYTPFDNLTLMTDLHADGRAEYEIIGSVAEALRADSADEAQIKRLREIFASPSLQLASFTITEKGYALRGLDSELLPVVKADLENGPERARHAMSLICSLMLCRFEAGAYPLALASMDNCSKNGEKLRASVLEIANAWRAGGKVSGEFVEYLSDESRVSFPWSMIDKITPRPASSVEQRLTAAGIADMEPITTARGTYIAPFVNAEIPQYLVIEDNFPNGRPALEKAGVYMTDRDTVNRTECMKVTTCLNPLHTALAVFGCLLGCKSIAEEMKDAALCRLVTRIGLTEGMPVVVDPGIISPSDFLREVIEQRLPNSFIPDTPQRIATDTSQKIPVRFGETIKAYLEHPELDISSLVCIPLVIAAWLRYLLGVDDSGREMTISSDPMLPVMQEALRGVTLGDPDSVEGRLEPILSNSALFGADLCACGLSERIEQQLRVMLSGEGGVRKALTECVGEE